MCVCVCVILKIVLEKNGKDKGKITICTSWLSYVIVNSALYFIQISAVLFLPQDPMQNATFHLDVTVLPNCLFVWLALFLKSSFEGFWPTVVICLLFFLLFSWSYGAGKGGTGEIQCHFQEVL